MKLEEEIFGITPERIQIKRFSLSNGTGLTVSVMSFGAILTSVQFPDSRGVVEEITLGFDTLEAYIADVWFFGATIGRYANRIEKGKFTLEGREYQLAQNSFPSHLHGGNRGFHKVVWHPRVHEDRDSASVTLSYLSADGEEGYPGNLSLEVTYTVNTRNELIYRYEARTDKPTPINMTNHTYWNLTGAGSGPILDHMLMLDADHYLPTDDDRIPTGEIKPVNDDPMDFRRPREIGSRIDEVKGGGYNHCYVLNHPGSPPSPAARVHSPQSGRVMEIYTTQPGVQFYTGHFLDGYRGASGILYNKYAGFCLETQHFPNSVNQPPFPSTILRPGASYIQTTLHRFYIN
jgi:aldose 1-epimerase